MLRVENGKSASCSNLYGGECTDPVMRRILNQTLMQPTPGSTEEPEIPGREDFIRNVLGVDPDTARKTEVSPELAAEFIGNTARGNNRCRQSFFEMSHQYLRYPNPWGASYQALSSCPRYRIGIMVSTPARLNGNGLKPSLPSLVRL